MAVQDLTTSLRGDTGVRGSSWSATAGVPTVTTDRLDGDQNYNTLTGDIYKLESSDWVLSLASKNIKSSNYDDSTGILTITYQDDTTDVTGDLRATSPTFATNVPVSDIAAGNPGTASVDNTDPLNPILSLGLVSGAQGASGTAKSSPFIVNQPNDYVELDIDNVGTTASLEQSILDFSVSKFATGSGFTDTEGKRLRFISDNSSTSTTGLLTGAGELGFSNYQINNSGTVAEAVADIIAEIQYGYVVKAADGRTTNLTWQLSASLKDGTTDVIEFRDPDSNLTLTTALVTNFSPVWTSSNIDEALSSEYTNAGVVYSEGDFAHRTIASARTFFVCDIGFTTSASNGTDDFPGNSSKWALVAPKDSVLDFNTVAVNGTKSQVDLIWTVDDYTASVNTGISIQGFGTGITDVAATTDLEFTIDATGIGLFEVSPRCRTFTTTARSDTLLKFLTDQASIANNPSASNTDPTLTTGTASIDHFNYTASVIDNGATITYRMISDGDGDWTGLTLTSADPVGGVTINAGYTSLTNGLETFSQTVAGQVFTQFKTMVFFGGILYLRTGTTITTTTSTAFPNAASSGWSSIALTEI